jgi:hypothetical protein
VSIRNCCNRPIIKNCYLEKGIAFIHMFITTVAIIFAELIQIIILEIQ